MHKALNSMRRKGWKIYKIFPLVNIVVVTNYLGHYITIFSDGSARAGNLLL